MNQKVSELTLQISQTGWTAPGRWLASAGWGAVLWAVPFAISIPFFTPTGELRVEPALFKTVMILSGSLTGLVLLANYLAHHFRGDASFWRFGLSTGVFWLLINWGLDFLVLLPLSGQTPGEYMLATGLGYVVIPMTSTGMALAMHRAAAKLKKISRDS